MAGQVALTACNVQSKMADHTVRGDLTDFSDPLPISTARENERIVCDCCCFVPSYQTQGVEAMLV